MEIRKLSQEEHNKVRPLYEEVFTEDSKGFVDYYFSEKTRDNDIYVVEEDGEICAMLHLNPYTLMVNGVEKQAHYIVAVATRKEYRGRGFMAALLRRALQDMYASGENFTFLMPAAEAIYTPHDFRTVYEQKRRVYNLADAVKKEAAGICIRPLTEEDCDTLAEWANEKLAADKDVYVKRDGAYYLRLMRECSSDGGKLMLFQNETGIEDCRIWFPDEDEDETPKIMTRIVDVRRMLMSLRLQELLCVCFTVIDSAIEENNRTLVLTGTEISGAMLMDGKPENSEGEIPIAALTSFVFGAKTVEELCEEDGVHMTERMKEEMKKIIPLSQIYLNEVV